MSREFSNNFDFSQIKFWRNKMSLYDRIIVLCKNKNISVNSLEKTIGISTGTISKWDISCPKATTLKKVADFFNVTMDHLLTGESSENSQTFANSFNNNKHSTITIQNGSTHTRELTELESELMKITSELPTKEKIKLVDYAYQLTDKKGE